MIATVPPFVVGIAGGSGSGKTSLAHALQASLGPGRVALLRHDAYYRDRPELGDAERARLNYDRPDAFDQPLFVAHLAALRAGTPVRPPRYCLATHRRLGPGEIVEPRTIVVVDGRLLLHDPDVRAALDLKVFLEVSAAARLARRIVRDAGTPGGPGASMTWIEPTRGHADLVLANHGRLDALAEIAATLIEQRLFARRRAAAGALPEGHAA